MKRTVIGLSLLLCLVSLPACMPRSVAALKAEYPEPYRFTVNKGYQAEYKDLVEYFDRCYISSIMVPFDKKNVLYPDLKMGEITLIGTMANFYSPGYMLHAIVAESNGRTEVSIYGAGGAWRGKWIETGECK